MADGWQFGVDEAMCGLERRERFRPRNLRADTTTF